MSFKRNLKLRAIKSASFLWYMQNFIRNGTFTPSIRKLHPTRKRVFVLGNGPSLNNDVPPHMEQLKNEDVMMVNQAITHSLALEIKPRYYVLMDPAYWGFYTDEEDTEDKFITACVQELDKSLEQVDWDMTILTPYHYYKTRTGKGIAPSNPHIQIATFNAVELYTFFRFQNWLYRHNFAIPSGINVLIAALSCAITMKYEHIYLLGADSNWHTQLGVDSDNRVYSLETHYYHDDTQKGYSPYSISFEMGCVAKVFKAYDALGRGFPQIYNLSSTSMIDAFPRSTLSSILNETDKKLMISTPSYDEIMLKP
ncbi:6-hydroxymethylpterin diphosphokinase MptE-like protein [uncultured Helicobacter sp.]|uniref:6-hydroxymethylpterin diphosphokinase MptE-like protein n=1 Tax=uncultured Helicobacter sp. TaxID=175537 RepID=UPI0025D6D061|nr:6-hydroxymethylpterin diphosphokinase MptE-like protein [uncultured Helicobacter sp.]